MAVWRNTRMQRSNMHIITTSQLQWPFRYRWNLRAKTGAQRIKIPKLPAVSSAFQSTRWSRTDLNASAVPSVPFKRTKSAPGECLVSIYAPHGTSQCEFMTEICRLEIKFMENCRQMTKTSRILIVFCLSWLYWISKWPLQSRNGHAVHVWTSHSSVPSYHQKLLEVNRKNVC